MFEKLTNRFVFSGILTLDTGLHIGSGKSVLYTDSPVIKDFDGFPMIPGSSLKGVLRSRIEQLREAIGISSCTLFEKGSHPVCLSVANENLENEFDTQREQEKPEKIYKFVMNHLCDSCKLFGSTVLAARLHIEDSHLANTSLYPKNYIEVRDGVGIDRKTETAADQAKYDYELVPKDTQFTFRLEIENFDENAKSADWKIITVGLLELINGNIRLGGNTSKGLGKIYLDLQRIEMVRITDKTALVSYLQNRGLKDDDINCVNEENPKPELKSPKTFLENKLNEIYA